MEIIGIGILFAVGMYIAPMVIGVLFLAIAGIIELFTRR